MPPVHLRTQLLHCIAGEIKHDEAKIKAGIICAAVHNREYDNYYYYYYVRRPRSARIFLPGWSGLR